jgi:hypothetical protein
MTTAAAAHQLEARREFMHRKLAPKSRFRIYYKLYLDDSQD